MSIPKLHICYSLIAIHGNDTILIDGACGVVSVFCTVHTVINAAGTASTYSVLAKAKANRKNNMTVTNPFIAYCLVYKDNINSVLGFISYNN